MWRRTAQTLLDQMLDGRNREIADPEVWTNRDEVPRIGHLEDLVPLLDVGHSASQELFDDLTGQLLRQPSVTALSSHSATRRRVAMACSLIMNWSLIVQITSIQARLE